MFKIKSFDESHPNPIFYREKYTILNGEWDFAYDHKGQGERKKYYESFPNELKINVPFTYNTKESGIDNKEIISGVWYKREINIESLKNDYILHFEGIDYLSKLWINSRYVATFKGGYIRHSINITEYLNIGSNTITVYAYDSLSKEQPRGKQRFQKKNFVCWYEENTGIYKDVWLEEVPRNHIDSFFITPNRDKKEVNFKFNFIGLNNELTINISYMDKLVASKKYDINSVLFETAISFDSIEEWNALDPKLYDVEFIYGSDKVLSYFAFRSLKAKDKKVYINDNEVYQKLVLDQGYFEGSLLTPPSPKALEEDIKLSISMGFNGARKHQKREDDRYYAYADMYGFIVWAEMPSVYKPSKKAFNNLKEEWEEIVKELYNHPSIICWTPINESWGVYLIASKKSERDFVNSLYDLTKSIDPNRFCLTNDGWEHTKSDFLTMHFYSQDPEHLARRIYYALNNGIVKSLLPYKYRLYVKGYSYNDVPIIISEFGGTSYESSELKEWGYGDAVKSDEEYKERLSSLFDALFNIKEISGYCFTQLTDVRQEVNGLLKPDRKPKISLEDIKNIQTR